MKKGDIKDKNGFTIIEVSLVLAIAGLIFLMIFIALPALQRSQRDTQRKDDIMSLIANIKKFQQNNRGALPTETGTAGTTWNDFQAKYLGSNFVDPSGGDYKLEINESCKSECDTNLISSIQNSSFPYGDFSIVIFLQATCDGEKAIRTNNPRKLAAMYKLEGGGTHCNNT